MRVGELRHYGIFQQLTGETNDYNEELSEWQDYFACDMKVNPIRNVESEEAGSNKAITTHEVYTRWSQGIKPKMRIKWIDYEDQLIKYFEIVGIKDKNLKHHLIRLIVTDLDIDEVLEDGS